MKVSVIVPVYNSSTYIDKCMTSLVNQTLDDIEIIVIDDGSNDDTLKKLEKYKRKIKLIKQKNSGVASARNKGLMNATGEYIAFVDSDDWIEQDMFQVMYNKAMEKNYDAVECDFKYVDDNKEWNGVIDTISDILTLDNKKKYFVNMFPVIWNKIYRRDKIKEIKFKDGEIFKTKKYNAKDIIIIKDVEKEEENSEEKEYQKELKELEKLEKEDYKNKMANK